MRAIDGADALFGAFPRIERSDLFGEVRPRIGRHHHEAAREPLVEPHQQAVILVRAFILLDVQRVELRILQEQAPARDGRAVAARVLGEEALERVVDGLGEERLGRRVTQRIGRAVGLRHVVERLDDRQVAAV